MKAEQSNDHFIKKGDEVLVDYGHGMGIFYTLEEGSGVFIHVTTSIHSSHKAKEVVKSSGQCSQQFPILVVTSL